MINIRNSRLLIIQGSRQDQVHRGEEEHGEVGRGVQGGRGVEGRGGVPHDAGAQLGKPQHLHI